MGTPFKKTGVYHQENLDIAARKFGDLIKKTWYSISYTATNGRIGGLYHILVAVFDNNHQNIYWLQNYWGIISYLINIHQSGEIFWPTPSHQPWLCILWRDDAVTQLRLCLVACSFEVIIYGIYNYMVYIYGIYIWYIYIFVYIYNRCMSIVIFNANWFRFIQPIPAHVVCPSLGTQISPKLTALPLEASS